MKENAIRYLQDKVGATCSQRKNIISKIFGKDGLAESLDDLTFEISHQEALRVINCNAPQFSEYYVNRLVPNLPINLNILEKTGMPIPFPCMNNNCESGNPF